MRTLARRAPVISGSEDPQVRRSGITLVLCLCGVTYHVARRLGDLRYVGGLARAGLRYLLVLLGMYLLFLYAWIRGYMTAGWNPCAFGRRRTDR